MASAKNGNMSEGNKAPAVAQINPEINPYRKWLECQPDPSSIAAETMQAAEEIAWKEVLYKIHPTWDDEEKRADITLFLRTLINHSFPGVEVFPYGSVPLKTYLVDGDIDLTVICSPDINKNLLADEIYTLLKNEQLNVYAEYAVKGTKLIDAKVKLVSCKVNKISVDISFNQLGGLSALCFMEQIDLRINKNHLFKQSILLIKAWCHYEAHVLGSFHNLLATYTLEVLILCLFQFFGSTLNGPLAVLYRFLDYYGKFDWSNYSISLDGPVRTSSLPDVVVADLGNDSAGLLLSVEDRRSDIDMFAYSSYSEQDWGRFDVQDLNIIDPLKENNNLGRMVYKGNFERIQSALKYGARTLGKILLLPRDSIPGEIKKFFEGTLSTYARSVVKVVESLQPLPPPEEDLHLEGAQLARDMDARENSDLLDLDGDYASLVRNFVHSRCTVGYSATLPSVRTLPPPTITYEQIMWTGTWCMQSYPAADEGQVAYIEDRHLQEMGRYVHNMFSTPFRAEYFYQPRVNQMPEPSRALQNGDANAVEEAIRNEENPINLNSEQDFPPLE
ncbi:uncharacterized protein LOC141660307 [Apium graveolens]|uniref:uncharacterized protein LOC141660307 n=1 Tax=Apium graveolens TaxID=4045 RepID=UPI003D79FECA